MLKSEWAKWCFLVCFFNCRDGPNAQIGDLEQWKAAVTAQTVHGAAKAWKLPPNMVDIHARE